MSTPKYSQIWFVSKDSFETLKDELNKLDSRKFLEIGSYEGMGTNYFCENFLTGKNDTITCIDPWETSCAPLTNYDNSKYDKFYPKSLYDTFVENVNNYKDKIIIKRGYSNNIVPLLKDNDYDLIFIDGDHSEKMVYIDAVNSFKKLKKNGFIVFDDYWSSKVMAKDENWGTDLAIDRFISENKEEIEIIFAPECSTFKGKRLSKYQVGIKKL